MNRIITVGTFDGLHRGHLEVLSTLRSEGAKRGLKPLVLTFDRHPLCTVAPERAPRMLMSLEEKRGRFATFGMEARILEFDASMAALTVDQWFSRLVHDYAAAAVVVGYDNTFGCDGIGMSIAQYREIASRHGLEIIEAPVLPGVSSSAIRRAVAEGRMEEAATMLGRPYEISGTVARGLGNGHKIGFPTANLSPSYPAQLPARGVYYGEAIWPRRLDNPKSLPSEGMKAVVNVGTHPTIDETPSPTIEAHILDFDGDLYDTPLSLKFIRKIRDEQRFPSLDALQEAIKNDIKMVKDYRY